jgi:hypothetical protein
MKRKLKNLQQEETESCTCTDTSLPVAYCSGGCVQCPLRDCGYYIVNFIAAISAAYS